MRYNGNKFSVYESEEKTVLGLLGELGSQVNHNTDTLDSKTDLHGDHKGSWQGLSRPTLSEEGMRAIVEDIADNKIPSIQSSLDNKANKSEIGSPLVVTSVEEMIDKTRVYVNTTDGKWYSWNGSVWAIGGVYNSQGIGDKSISPIKTTFLHISPNLFNKDNIIDNKGVYPYKDSLFGTLYDTNDSVASDWIEVKPNTQYIKNFKGCVVTYDESKIPLDGWDNAGANVGFTFTTTPNVKYVRLSIMKIHSLSACQFQEGNVITDIKPYGEIELDENIKVKVQNQVGNTDIYTKFNSLRWLAFGDSHTEQQSYQKWVNNKLNFTYISNSGLGGSCIAKGHGSVLSFIDRYKSNVTNTEIVTIYGGSNDYAQNVPLDNESNKLDNTTFKGAIREIIEWYGTNYPNKFLFFIAPTQCFYPQFASNGYKNNLGLLPLDYSNAMVEVCEEYSIEVIKLHESIGINIKNQATLLEDGIHLKDETNKRVAQLIINSFEKIYY